MFLWTCGMQFRQSRQKRLGTRPGNFQSLSENDIKIQLLQNNKIFPPTCSSAHVECNFDNPWNSYGNRPKMIVQLPNMLEKVQNFWKFFPKMVLMDRWNECTLKNPVKNFPQKAKKITLTVRKWKWNKIWWEDYSTEVLLW